MSDIRIGDRVTFQQRTSHRKYLHAESGTVVSLNSVNATVLCDNRLHVVEVGKLAKVGAIEAVVEPIDYELMTKLAGDLSGAEINFPDTMKG